MAFLNSAASKLFDLNAYGYDLPEDLIAQYPCAQRDGARLMVLDRAAGSIRHGVFSDISRYLPPRTIFVVNNSKVIAARLLGHRVRVVGEACLPKLNAQAIQRRQVEVLLLDPLSDGYSFEALLRPLKKIREGELLDFGKGISAVLIDKEKCIVRFDVKNVLGRLKGLGHIPLPPYIKRADEELDRDYYQNVYAKRLGSVASPTAGLHFTKALIKRLKAGGHELLELTLHINYGTFKPVETPDIRQHPMHAEGYGVSAATHAALLKAKTDGRLVAAVGTTACRVLESIARTNELKGTTDLFIYPGYEFKTTDILLTNFHLPHSTLLMLACALGGYDLVRRAYAEAIKERYRFYSYGDAMLIV